MATWFAVIDRITQTRGIGDSGYKNVLEFDEGDLELSFFGTGRLTGDEDCSQRQEFSSIPMIIPPHHRVHLPAAHFRIRL
jgi:hypothetical protein